MIPGIIIRTRGGILTGILIPITVAGTMDIILRITMADSILTRTIAVIHTSYILRIPPIVLATQVIAAQVALHAVIIPIGVWVVPGLHPHLTGGVKAGHRAAPRWITVGEQEWKAQAVLRRLRQE